jgi:hypothetical protein
MKAIIPVFVVALVLAYGCSGGGSDSVAETPADLNGTSLGIVLVTGGTAYPPNTSFPITFDLVQSGDTVTGEYSTSATALPTRGTVAGTLSGRTFSFTLTEEFPCSGSFAGSTTVASNGISFSGPYSGGDCSGTTEAWLSVSK